LKVAVVLEAVFPENKGGLERWYFYLGHEIAKNVETVHYLNSAGINREKENLRYINITNHEWNYLDGGVRSIKQAIQFLSALIKWMWRHNYDFIYISSVPIISIFVIPIVRIKNPKTVIVVEWLEYWPYRYWRSYKKNTLGTISWLIQLIALQFGTYRTTFIRRTYNTIKSRNAPWLKRRTLLLPGLVNDNLVVENSENKTRNDIVLVGRLVEEKQPLFAISIIEKYIDLGWSGTFWIVGTGPEEQKIRKLLAGGKFEGQIKLLVNASDGLIVEKFNSSFLLLHPSKREGYGLVCVEAAFKGLPALLINYPDNGAVDLGINPDLVSSTDKVEDILELIHYAKLNFSSESLKSSSWAQESMYQKTVSKSVIEILRIANRNV
jgi:glycosyltransferase involved in cell wall biosynthesis